MSGSTLAGELVELEPFGVQVDPRSEILFTVGQDSGDTFWDREALNRTGFSSWENLWRRHPSFDSFRRADSRTAHPTTQGMRLRPLATNASSRSLVLLDQLPLNDPFGGWVYTQHLFQRGWQEVAMASGGRAAVWGSPGYGGVILLQRGPIANQRDYLLAGLGSQGRTEVEGGKTVALGARVHLQIQGRWADDPGFYVVDSANRGAIDVKAGVESISGSLRLGGMTNGGLEWETGWRGWEEKRVNGTAISINDSEAHDVYLHLRKKLGMGTLQLSAFRQWRGFRNVFTSAADDRNSEMPALNQYAVPSFATGGSLVWKAELDSPYWLQSGIDFREIKGTVRERYLYVNGAFNRQREAGGRQLLGGAFIQGGHQWQENRVELSGMLRLDRYALREGFRREMNTANDALLRDDAYANRNETAVSGFAELKWRPDARNEFQFSVHHGHRMPTLNELYRPYRVRNDIVEANPELGPERAWGIDAGSLLHLNSALRLQARAWYQWLDEMVTNVVLVQGPSSDPRFGFVPAGGTGAQRLAVEDNRAYGWELALMADLSDNVQAHIQYTGNRTRFGPALGGDSFPLSPRHNLRAGADWQPIPSLNLGANLRWQSEAVEDGGRAVLPSFGLLDVHLRWTHDSGFYLQCLLENVLDETVITAESSAGLRSIGAPRNLFVQVGREF